MKTEKKRLVEVKIDSFSPKGNGMATYQHPQGMEWILEIPFARPGDFVRAQLLKKRRGIFLCKLEKILEPSPKRITPKCTHFGVCGGCRWQHTSYVDQLKLKESIIQNCFSEILNSTVKVHPIIPADSPWEYRNKMEFSFSSNLAGEKFLGLMIDSSHGKVLNLTECHLVNSWFIEVLKSVREWWEESTLLAYHPYKNTGSLRTLTVRKGQQTGEKMVVLTVSGNPEYALHKGQLEEFVRHVKQAGGEAKLSIFIEIQQIAKGKPTEFFEMLLDGPDTIQENLYIKKADVTELLKFQISPSAFFQPSTLQAEKLYSEVVAHAAISPNAVVYDLYCGTGTLGICIAKHVKEVIGVEISPEASLDAKANLSENRITNMRVITGPVGLVLDKIEKEKEIPPPDVVVVDPPRAGLEPQAIRLLLTLNPDKIVYVSCNPVSQAANIKELIAGQYQLESLQPVDQFPQTVHIENIAVLRKKNGV